MNIGEMNKLFILGYIKLMTLYKTFIQQKKYLFEVNK